MRKRIIVIIGIILLALIAGVFWYNKNQLMQQDSQKIKEQKSEDKQENKSNISECGVKDLVWYEIPELNIKFLVEKEIADALDYRDFYVQDSKANGKELYVKGVDIAFGEILVYSKNDTINPKYNMQAPAWDTICAGSSSRILFKNSEKILCYNNLNKTININSLIIRKIFNNYLGTVNVKLINK